MAGERQASGRVGIIAGGGGLPLAIIDAMKVRGENPFVIALRGSAAAIPNGIERAEVDTAEPGKMIATLRKAGVTDLVLAGSVNSRPDLARFRPDWTTLKLLPRIAALLRRGDDGLLRSVIAILEGEGFRVRAVHDIAPSLLAFAGPIAGPSPSPAARADIEAAARAARAIGALDIGQGAVSVGGRVVALEGAEGTDAMLERVAAMRAAGRISAKARGVLVKCAKPGQDRRVDLPTIGPSTIRNAAAAGLEGVAVEAGDALVLDIDDLVAEAERLGVFAFGIAPDSGAGA